MNYEKAYQPCGDYSSKKVGGEFVVINMETGEYHTFNPVGGLIWEMTCEKRSISEIIEAILSRFEVSKEQAAVEAQKFLDNLLQQGLLEEVE